MTIKSLFKKRQALYYKELLKYFQYIFNDHFSLVVFFLIGGGGYAYSNYLDSLSSGNLQPLMILVFIYFFLVLMGSVTLIVEEADQLFLLAKEEEFYPILKGAVFKSYLQSLVSIALTTFITFPIFAQTSGATVVEGFLIFLALASLKWLSLLVKIYPYFSQSEEAYQKYKYILYFITLVGIVSLNFLTITGTAFILSIVAVVSLYLFYAEKIYFDHSLKWEAMIEIEEARLHTLYRFIELFTDVPHMETTIKRLNGLDSLLIALSKRYPEAPYYYLLRKVARNTEYSALVFRLTIIGSVFIYAMESYWFSILFTLLFIYILGFQLISLVKEIDRVPQFQFYPVTEKKKVDSSLYLINQLLLFMTAFFTISSILNRGIVGMTVLPIGILAAYLFSHYYVPFRLQE